MATVAKRACSAGDRLSALPVELRRHILSFLPAQEVVRTTVLSKRWIDLWRAVPGINLDIDDFRREGEETWESFEDFTTNLLMLHNASYLDAFRLNMDSKVQDRQRVVERWIRCGIKGNPLVLSIKVYCLPGLNDMLSIHLGPCRRLKRLDLFGVSLDHSFGEQFNSWFTDLEGLTLVNCRIGFAGIQSDKLKNLVVDFCQSQTLDEFAIRAPLLASLWLDITSQTFGNVSIDAGNSLVKASISVATAKLSPRTEAALLGSLFSVMSLELYRFQSMTIINDEEFTRVPVFNNLRILSLSRCFNLGERDVRMQSFEALGRFLKKSPNLEKLTLKDIDVMPVATSVELPMLEHLRILILFRCNLHDNFRLLRYCLRSSPNLEKLSLEYCKLSEGSAGGKEKAKSNNMYSQSSSLVPFQCPKLKDTEIIYFGGGYDNITELVGFLLDLGCARENTIKFTKI